MRLFTENDLTSFIQKQWYFALATYIIKHLKESLTKEFESNDHVAFDFPSIRLILKDTKGKVPRFEIVQ